MHIFNKTQQLTTELVGATNVYILKCWSMFYLQRSTLTEAEGAEYVQMSPDSYVIFRIITLRNLINACQHSGGTYCLHFCNPEDKGSIFFWTIGTHLAHYKMSHIFKYLLSEWNILACNKQHHYYSIHRTPHK
jgi:hypothetical protein